MQIIIRFKKDYSRFYKYEKIRFLIFGIFNTFTTNILLQIFLIIMPISLATFFSQGYNLLIGYYLYKYKVFRVSVVSRKKIIFYVILAFSSWQINWILISYISNILNVSRNISAIIVLPIIAIWSYLIQKLFIFNL